MPLDNAADLAYTVGMSERDEKHMRLYFWADPYSVTFGSSMVFAVAASEEEARQIVTDPGKAKSYSHWEFLQNCLPLKAPKLGPPTRVVDLPCAEWHEWSE